MPSSPYKIQPMAVSKEFRDLVLESYPALKGGDRSLKEVDLATVYRRILEYVLFSTFADDDTGEQIFPHDTMAEMARGYPKAYRLSASWWMRKFSQDVGIPLNPTDYTYKKKKARCIRPEINQEILDATAQECQWASANKKRVWFVSGLPVTRTSARDAQKKHEAYLRDVSESTVGEGHPAYPIVSFILEKQDHSRKGTLKKTLNRNLPRVWDAIEQFPTDTPAQVGRKNWCTQLMRSLDLDLPMFYRGSGGTPRIHAAGSSINQLPRDLRKMALAGCYEFDLKSAQLAVVARIWDIPTLQTFLEGGGSIWKELSQAGGVDQDTYKPILKRTIYSIVFGMGWRNYRAQLIKGVDNNQDHEPGVGVVAARKILKHHLIVDLLAARTRVYHQAEQDRGAEDAWGNWRSTTYDLNEEGTRRVPDIPSVLAYVVQSYELRLMLPLMEVVRDTKQIYLMSWLHDGVTLDLGNSTKAKRHIRSIEAAVIREADGLGIITKLEVANL